jgi:hypothetical protein
MTLIRVSITRGVTAAA